MSIEKYVTEGLILKKYEQGENDLTFKVFTFEFGIIFVLAKSIRKINAKLRMQMQVYHFVKLTLVRGREVWRLTGASEIIFKTNNKIEKIENVVIISECLNRFLPSEKPHQIIFEKLKDILSLEKIYLNDFRTLVYYVVLVDTGYADCKVIGVQNIEEYKSFKAADLQTYFILNEKEVKFHIKKVLSESML